MVKRFVLFVVSNAYYPKGGWEDFRASYDTKAEAVQAGIASRKDSDWWHVVDMDSAKVVAHQNDQKTWEDDT